MRRARFLSSLVLAAVLAIPGAAIAQRAGSGKTVARDTAKPTGAGTSIREFFGVPIARRLLWSDDAEDRIRGIERLGSLGTDDAIDALVSVLESGGTASTDTKARLVAVRVLAAHTDKEPVRQVLVRELSTAVGPEARGTVSPLQSLLRKTAALALARAGTKKTTEPLLQAVERGGLAGDAASMALRAYPPASLESFFDEKKKLPPSQIAFLGDLGDLRAIEKLRPLIADADKDKEKDKDKDKESDVRLAAVVALAKLGDETALATVRPWLKRGDPRLLKAATEVLVYLGAPETGAAISALLASDVTRDAGLTLALRSPSRALAEPLSKALEKLGADDKPRAIAALGRVGGPDAVKYLALEVEKTFGGGDDTKKDDAKKDAKSSKKEAKDAKDSAPKDGSKVPELALGALFALATMPGDDAKGAIDKLLADPRAAKDDAFSHAVVRAGIVRFVVRGEAPAALASRLEKWATSKDDTSRAIAALGQVATGAKSAADVIASCTEKKCDEPVLRAAARGALARGGDALAPFMDLLEKPWARGSDLAKPSRMAVAAAVGLLANPGGRGVPTSTLAAWAEGGGPLSPLAARALPTRDDDVTRGRIKRLLEGSDPVVRAHVALGLGKDPEKDAVTLLVNAYRFEDDAQVRSAIVRALSERKEPQRVATLETARALDPDDGVRALARAALTGRALTPTNAVGQAAAWIAIEDNDAGGKPTARSGRVVRSDGVAVPFVADPDGVLLVPGLPYQKFNLQLGSDE
ncbi:MAG: HEAT repeat domain-containing protein [Polyangiaceae bacterium]